MVVIVWALFFVPPLQASTSSWMPLPVAKYSYKDECEEAMKVSPLSRKDLVPICMPMTEDGKFVQMTTQ